MARVLRAGGRRELTGMTAALDERSPARRDTGRAGKGARILWLLRAHWLFAAVLVAGAVLRALTTVAYRPALLYIDSFRYLSPAGLHLDPTGLEPIGYDLFVLHPLLLVGGLRFVVVVQHLAGIGIGVLCYALALRHRLRRPLAALAAVPILLDGYQLQIEQNIMSDLWLELVLAVVAWVLLARGVPNARRCALAGVLLGVAVLLRVIAIVAVVPAFGFLLCVGWRALHGQPEHGRARVKRVCVRAGAFALCWVAIVGGYCGYFYSYAGRIGITATNSNVLYARASDSADCATLRVARPLRQFCQPKINGREVGIDYYAHLDLNPNFHPDLPPGVTTKEMMHRFALAVIRQQPMRMVVGVFRDFAKGFAPTKTTSPGDVVVSRWQFQTYYPFYDARTNATTRYYDGIPASANHGVAAFLRAYQLHGGYTPGTVLGIAAALGLVGGAARRGKRRGPSMTSLMVSTMPRAPSIFLAVTGLVILLASDAFEFSWRYQLPALVLFPLAGVLGLAALFPALRRSPRAEKA